MAVVILLSLMVLVFLSTMCNENVSAWKNVQGALSIQKTVENVSYEQCTFALLREAYKSQGYFPGGGEWLAREDVPYFQPAICKLRYPRVSNSFMTKCLSKANVSYILTMGDSTAGMYSHALRRTLTLNSKRLIIEKPKEDGFLPDKDYYTREMPDEVVQYVTAKFRFCKGCASKLHQAKFYIENSLNFLNIEHIAQTMILDDSLQLTFPSYIGATKVMDKVWAITTQELILRYYLKDKHPDVFLIFLPFVHAKGNTRLSRLPMEIEYLKGLVEEYLPNTTKLFYITSYGEFEERRKSSEWYEHSFEGMLARDKIDKMNRILYDVLEGDLLKRDGRYFGFFDLIDISEDRGNWSTDSVHMKVVWYESIMSMFWETYCNSVLLDMF
ncbi:hypothetical protein LSH36_82g06002 [Paralvinella palmiformis]|uniref:Uncharacterized protein n=1 Tax=Paralvinella palmiformis TaxID=53620 RepID=A0AAD9NCM4_9ANNE|nr:hypothetical protein LSH36_82g06002 [Paralvinella palmiformis]